MLSQTNIASGNQNLWAGGNCMEILFTCEALALTGPRYCHVITGNEQQEQPDESGGGILADEMGMGKSLTTLVLMAKTLREARQWVEGVKALPGASLAETPTRATLVIVPSRGKDPCT